MVPPAERLRWCTARQLVEEGKLMLNCEEKAERLELLDAVADAERLARGLERIGDAARILEAQNEILYVEERTV